MVRRAERSDLSALAALCTEHAQFEGGSVLGDGLAKRLGDTLFGESSKAAAWVAVEGRDVIGFATASPVFCTWMATDFLHMDCLYLIATARGHGGGKLLLEAVCTYANACGFSWLEWQTPAWNSAAIMFYERLGATALSKQRFSMQFRLPPS